MARGLVESVTVPCDVMSSKTEASCRATTVGAQALTLPISCAE